MPLSNMPEWESTFSGLENWASDLSMKQILGEIFAVEGHASARNRISYGPQKQSRDRLLPDTVVR